MWIRATLLLSAVLGVVTAMAASWFGWLGIAQVCGADRALGCVDWPMPISLLVWAAFVIGVLALLVWQVRYLDRR